MPSTLATEILAVLDRLSGGVHAGFRLAHAKGTMYAGTFTPSSAAAGLTRAPHANRPSTPVTVQFSLSAGIPTAADNDLQRSGPQGMAVRFHLAETGTAHLTAEQAAVKPADFLAAEMSERLAAGPAVLRIMVQLADAGDNVTSSPAVWPESRPLVEFGRLTISERADDLAPERRKIIFDPVPRVDGIDSAGDPLTELRSEIHLVSGRRRRGNS
jgi:catalase